jgi:hypothetical protein
MADPIRKRGLNGQVGGDDVVATPEGDNEYKADEPVGPVDGLQVAGGNAPLAYDADKDKRSHPHENPQDADHPAGTDRVANDRVASDALTNDGADRRDDHRHADANKGEVEETVDKLSLGQILT